MIEPSNTACYVAINDLREYFYFTNAWYLEADIVSSWCDEVDDEEVCYMPWIDAEYDAATLRHAAVENNISDCLTFDENLAGLRQDVDPCLAYHDSDN